MSALARTAARRHPSPRSAAGVGWEALRRRLATGWLALAAAALAPAAAGEGRLAAGWLAGVALAALLGEMLRRSCARAEGGARRIAGRLRRGAAARFAIALAALAAAGAAGLQMPAMLAGFAAAQGLFAVLGMRALWRATLHS